MMQVLQNSGIMFDDSLDKLRGDAIVACQSGLPDALILYLHALEDRYLTMMHEQHLASVREVGWKRPG